MFSTLESSFLNGQTDGVGTIPLTGGLQTMRLLGVSTTTNNGNIEDSGWRWSPFKHQNKCDMYSAARALFGNTVLFVIERDINKNVVLYKAVPSPTSQQNTVNVEAFWLMIPPITTELSDKENSDQSDSSEDDDDDDAVNLGNVHTEDLTLLERTLAYGLTCTQLENGGVRMFCKALRGEPIDVVQDDDGWHARVRIQGELHYLQRVLVSTEERSWGLWPKTTEVHMQCVQLPHKNRLTYHYKL